MAAGKRKRRAARVVAITGGGNFLGSQLAARLDADPAFARVVVLDAGSSIASSPRTRHYDIDIAKPGADARLAEALAAEGADTVVHAAFIQAPTHQVEYVHELESIGTMNVLAACEGSSVRRLVVWSHTFLYGARPDNPALLPDTWPLRGNPESLFIRNKIEVEQQVAAFAARASGAVATVVLRAAPVVGPNSDGVAAAMMRRRLVPVAAGFDPLVQVVHEYDLVEAFRLAVGSDATGAFNIVAEGVLPLVTAILLTGRVPVPMPRAVLKRVLGAAWMLRMSEAAAPFVDYLTYPCVADGARAVAELGFRSTYTTQEALCDFAGRALAPRGSSAPGGAR